MNDQDSYRATRAAPWEVLVSQAAAGMSPALTPTHNRLRPPPGRRGPCSVLRYSDAGLVDAQQHATHQQAALAAIPDLSDWACATQTPGQTERST